MVTGSWYQSPTTFLMHSIPTNPAPPQKFTFTQAITFEGSLTNGFFFFAMIVNPQKNPSNLSFEKPLPNCLF